MEGLSPVTSYLLNVEKARWKKFLSGKPEKMNIQEFLNLHILYGIYHRTEVMKFYDELRSKKYAGNNTSP